jgi:hypothetical protein
MTGDKNRLDMLALLALEGAAVNSRFVRFNTGHRHPRAASGTCHLLRLQRIRFNALNFSHYNSPSFGREHAGLSATDTRYKAGSVMRHCAGL